MVKKKDKAKRAERKVRTAAKAEKVATKKDKKASTKPRQDDDSSAESDVDLDAVLATYAAQQERFLKVTESPSSPPSARSSATLIASPANTSELFLFGGEHYNGGLARFYNDLFVYNIARDEWRLVTSPNSPLPRSGHAWTRGGNQGAVWLFGGEFSSPKQGTFYHYGDFWKLEPGSREWSKVETKGKGPPARSGHRMTYFKQYIILFGGFQDTSQSTKYLSDLWIYDCNNFQWHNPTLPPASQKPEPRSSFSFLPHESGAVLYGGYSRVKTVAGPTRQAKSGPSTASRAGVLKPLVHQDTWFLRITSPGADAPSSTPPTVRWERRKRPANPPNPPRAGATMAYHRGRGIQFGGVHDVENSDEGIDSEFFNTLFVWNIDRNRFFSLALKRPKVSQKKAAQPERGRRERGRATEEELLRNLAALEMKSSMIPDIEVPVEGQIEQDLEDKKQDKPVAWEMPHPRFNAQLTVQDDILFICGGTFEKGDQEFTFDDMLAIDLAKLDGVKEIYRRELEDWQGSDEDENESDEEDDDMDGSNDGDEDMPTSPATKSQKLSSNLAGEQSQHDTETASLAEIEVEDVDEILVEVEGENATSSLNDSLPHPRPFEALRDFYARTSQQWQAILLQESNGGDTAQSKSVKEVRKGAFDIAEEKWWDCREEIRALEDEQEEAGIGEIVSLVDKAASDTLGGAGRRR